MKWSHIIIHHSWTKDTPTVSWGAIRRYHTSAKPDGRGWSDIGYHWGAELVGGGFEVLMGRPMNRPGAHAREMRMNSRGIGICFVGNYDLEHPAEKMLERVDDLISWLMDIYDIPAENILGHREVGKLAGFDWREGQFKTCPGTKWSMEKFRQRYA